MSNDLVGIKVARFSYGSGSSGGWYQILKMTHNAYHPYSYLGIYLCYSICYDQYVFSNLVFGTENIEGKMNRCSENIISFTKGSTENHIESGFKYLSKVDYKQSIGWFVKFAPNRFGYRTFTFMNLNAEQITTTTVYFDIKYTEYTDEDIDIRYYDGQKVTS